MTKRGLVVVAAALLVVLSASGAAVAAAQDAPGEPASYYGSVVDEDGTPAPVGTTIVAVVDGEVEGEITVSEAGSYGGSGAVDSKITVDSSGDSIEFRVGDADGPAAVTVDLDEGDIGTHPESGIHRADLTFPAGTFESAPAVESIAVSLDDDTIEPGDETTATVTATLEDGSTEDVTDRATIESGDTDVATVDGATVTGESDGSTTIAAEYAGMTADTALTVDTVSSGGGGSDTGDDAGDDADDDDDSGEIDETPDGNGTATDEPADTSNGSEVVRSETVSVSVDNETGESVARTNGTSVEEIRFGDEAVSGNVTVSDLSNDPEETGPSPGTSVAAVEISVPDEATDTPATVRVNVDRERVDAANADAEDLRVHRYTDGEWQPLESEVVEETDDGVVLEADTPGFSYFSVSAVSEPSAAIDAPAEVTLAEDVSLDGSGSSTEHGEIVAWEWTVDGETLSGETVTTAFDDAGEYTVELTVENDAGETDTASTTLSVVDAATATATAAPTDEPSRTEDGPPVLGIGVGIAVLLAAIAGLALYGRGGGGNDPLS